jgi:uncharacterized membrane protein (GlpM family)
MFADVSLISLLLKVVAAASVVVVASLVAEKVGPFAAGLIAALPVSAGPAYVLMALHGDDGFIAASALGSVATNAANGLFLVTYVFLARRCRLLPCFGGSIVAWLAAAAALMAIHWTVTSAAALNVAFYALGIYATRRVVLEGASPRLPRRWFDLPARAMLVGCLVALVVTVSRAIGPTATGVATLFPIMFSSLAIILHVRLGGRSAAAAMASALRAMPGFGLGLLVLTLTARPWGSPAALFTALLTCLGWSGGLMVIRSKMRSIERPSPEEA